MGELRGGNLCGAHGRTSLIACRGPLNAPGWRLQVIHPPSGSLRDRPPMTQDAVLPPSHRPRWQHVEEADHGRYALTHNCCLHGTAFPLTAVALLNGRQCCRCATPRDCCAGWCVTCWRRQHDVNGRRRRPGRATNLHDSDDAAAAGRRDIDVKLLDAQVLPSRYTPCIVWNTVYP